MLDFLARFTDVFASGVDHGVRCLVVAPRGIAASAVGDPHPSVRREVMTRRTHQRSTWSATLPRRMR
jgi:hypothetical protein